MSEENLRDKPESYWKDKLTPQQYHILREAGTERPFTGDLLKVDDEGVFRCAACGAALFSSETKYKSGSGWPSFWQALDDDSIELRDDKSYGMVRTEVVCASCGGHLGHLFNDGPQPTGQRYCINSAALNFDPEGGE